jgi:hypothetical protein
MGVSPDIGVHPSSAVKIPSKISGARKPTKFSRSVAVGIQESHYNPVTPLPARPPPAVVFMSATGQSPASNVHTGDTAGTASTATESTLAGPWQAAVNESIATIRTQQKQAKRAIVFMSNEMADNSANIHTLQHAVTAIKSESIQIKLDSSKLIRMMERAYGKCSENDAFNAELDQGNTTK